MQKNEYGEIEGKFHSGSEENNEGYGMVCMVLKTMHTHGRYSRVLLRTKFAKEFVRTDRQVTKNRFDAHEHNRIQIRILSSSLSLNMQRSVCVNHETQRRVCEI